MLESAYQARLITKLKSRFPGCIVLKNDSSYQQGIPDLTMFYGPYWAALEVKAHVDADQQPNQEYYVDQMNEMSFAAFIYPENEKEVLNALELAFEVSRPTRRTQRVK